MKPVIAALAFLGTVACATSGSGVDPRLEYTYNSSVTGVIVVPDASASSEVCNNLSAVATVGDTQLGRSAIRQSKGRCSYQIDNLPADKDVTVKIQPATDLRCQDGSQMAFVSDDQGPLKLAPSQGKLHDFRAQCGTTRS
ncbi:MAG TPA: hypothetical protein VFN91_00690 [Myxococcaceae bacterium]|nr:hypothetical protein [Myxococcaceae bacterium]